MARDPSIGLVLFVACTMICLSSAATMPVHNVDLPWQRWSGETILRSHRIATSLGPETFTAPGAPWIPQEWLFAVATTMTDNRILAGIFGVGIGSAVAGAIGLAVYRTRNRSHSNGAVSAAVVLITAMIIPFESLRAEYIGWLFVSMSLVIIETGNVRSMTACLFISVLWANIHASVILLPMLFGLRAASYALIDRRVSSRVASAFAFSLGTLACSWINPVGIRLTTFAFDLQKNVLLTTNIHEWQAPSLEDPIVAYVVLPLVIYGVVGTVARRKLWDFLLIATFGYLSFRAGRHIALLAIVAAPAAIAAFSPIRPSEAYAPLDPLWVKRYAVTLSSVFAAATILFVFFTPASVRGDAGVAYAPASDVVLGLPGKHRVFCQDFTWCSFLLGHPRFKVWWDGRADAYPADVWRRALEITANRPRGVALRNLDRFAVDVVITKEGAPVNDALAASQWQLLADLKQYMVWRRRPAR